jgi:hypothetical protein
MSQQAVSADIIQISAVGIFSPKTEGTKTYFFKKSHQRSKTNWVIQKLGNIEAKRIGLYQI